MANVERDGKVSEVSPEDVAIGEIIVMKPGERVPIDGKVIEGETSLDTAALTGESLPRDISVGDSIMSGCINLSGVVRVKTTKVFGESTVSKIIDLVESADKNKSKSESFITKFARVYTPVVVMAALTLAFIPPVFGGGGLSGVFPDLVASGPHFPGGVLPLCAGDQCASVIFRRAWCGVAEGGTDQGQQLCGCVGESWRGGFR